MAGVRPCSHRSTPHQRASDLQALGPIAVDLSLSWKGARRWRAEGPASRACPRASSLWDTEVDGAASAGRVHGQSQADREGLQRGEASG